jgi:hypothetical protein
MKSQTHTLRSKEGKEGYGELFAPLSEHATEPAVKRVENVLTLLVAANTLAREQREQMRFYERAGKDWRREDGKSFRESLHVSIRTWGKLNAALTRYPTLAMSQGRSGKFEIVERPVTSSTGRWAPWERWAVGTLLSLAKKPGELSRLRRCLECSQWFYAIRGHQRFCGEPCRRRHTAQNPEFKAMRADYMKQYRIDEVGREERAKRLAKGGKGK